MTQQLAQPGACLRSSLRGAGDREGRQTVDGNQPELLDVYETAVSGASKGGLHRLEALLVADLAGLWGSLSQQG
ncbi:hypothetical protein RRF57_005358 [Xylaria bambusicola]|uniref:Uncharacterized protein n=1 Tax=Xylaria bambusicola TaxID=326684 RepID=A0AAN7UMQ5_9PEZI